MNHFKERLENFLNTILSQKSAAPRLQQALEYCVLGGGKRLRPLLVYVTGKSFGASLDELDAPAAAVEFIHCYSLIHDDLPSMDDDDFRRGKLACHKKFDEATAILTGDALQALAFEVLVQGLQNSEEKIDMIETLAKASGASGMVAGQMMDLNSEGKNLKLEELVKLHSLKTGALFSAAIRLGALAGKADEKSLNILQNFSEKIGLAFQIQDDILDIEGCSEKLGKLAGADIKLKKATYPGIMGLESAKRKVRELQQDAVALLENILVDTKELKELSLRLTEREC